MEVLGSITSGLTVNPLIGLIVFIAVSVSALWALSGGKLLEAFGGIIRLIITLFTTPFMFLRDALSIVRASAEAEQDYVRTRTFMLFRYSRLQYLTILVVALLVLSAGVTSALLSLWPAEQIAQGQAAASYVQNLREQVAEAQTAVNQASSPEQRQTLQTARDQAESTLQSQQQGFNQYLQGNLYNHQLISQVANSRNANGVANTRDQLDNYMRDCPRGYYWSGFNLADCQQFRDYAFELANRRIALLNAESAFREADNAFNQADSAAQSAQQRLDGLQQSLASAQEQQRAVSLFNPQWIVSRLSGAVGLILATAMIVIGIVWFGAILIDVLNWIILMMRVKEKDASSRLERAGAEYQS